MITLIANGCSHTAGSEIEYAAQRQCYQNAWPRWLADDMRWDWVNLAEPGNSNEQIKRTTLNWIIKNVELTQQFKPEELVVIIMWSGFNRFEVWNSKHNKLMSCNPLSLKYWDDSQGPQELAEYIKYKTITENDGVTEYKNLLDVYLTAKYLESLNIKYYFINALSRWRKPTGYEPLSLKSDYQNLINVYGHRIKKHLGFYLLEERFCQYLNDNNIPTANHSVRGHWGIDGHKFWSNHIKEWMASIDNT